MNLIIPMAGRGSRLRPHTLTIPKPLIPVAGKPIVQRLVEDISAIVGTPFENIGFIIGDFGTEVEENLLKIAEELGSKGHIFHQDKPLGTAHAVFCAESILEGKVIVAFADTLFKADFTVDDSADGVIWVQKVEDPRAFGVVQMDDDGIITNFVEKPQEFVSDLAIIGIYYLHDGKQLKEEIAYLIDNDIKDKGEYQLTNALENLKQKGWRFKPGAVTEWLDCGNKDAVVYTNQRILEFNKDQKMVSETANLVNSVLIPPCFVGQNATVVNSVIGPHVSIGKGSTVENSVINNTVIQEDSRLENKVLTNSMIGNTVTINGAGESLSLGDFTTIG